MSSDRTSSHCFQKSMFVKDFRNIAELSLTFGERHNLFIGPNGHGKTNCLEAIAIACSLKPMQALHNNDLIRFDMPQAKIVAHVTGVTALDVDIDIFSQGKKAKLNQHPLRSSAQLAKYCPLVSFIPSELNLVAGSQSLRRRALDQAANAFFAEHILVQRAYEKILLHRNRLLKDAPSDRNSLDIFTDLLISEGAKLIHYRLKAIEQLGDIFSQMLKSILGPAHNARLGYSVHEQALSDFAPSDLCALLQRIKGEVEGAEKRRRVTLFGPHLDDISFLLNGVDAKSFASRGQTRALVFAFKLAQMMAIFNLRGHAPIIILDDIVSELDSTLKANLIETVSHLKTQVFFSATDIETFGNYIALDRVFSIRDGSLVDSRASR